MTTPDEFACLSACYAWLRLESPEAQARILGYLANRLKAEALANNTDEELKKLKKKCLKK